MPVAEAEGYRFNPFDLTKVWPHADYPPVTIGRMVLNRNPENYFAEVEQAAFEPSNMVPGIEPSPDKMLLGRLFSYPDTHRYRIGPNYLQLPINQPKSEVNSYNKDGAMRYRHSADQPVYAPNSYGGPAADEERYGESFHASFSGALDTRAVRAARRGRRLRAAGRAVPRGAVGTGPHQSRDQHHEPPERRRIRPGTGAGARLLAQRRSRPRRARCQGDGERRLSGAPRVTRSR